jgi:hypothetical protein
MDVAENVSKYLSFVFELKKVCTLTFTWTSEMNSELTCKSRRPLPNPDKTIQVHVEIYYESLDKYATDRIYSGG